MNQPCCSNACACSVAAPCPPFAPVPSRCVLDEVDAPVDHALCMTSSTLDDETQHRYDDGLDPFVVTGNFTIAFWAKARQALNFSQSPTTTGGVSVPRGLVFSGLNPRSTSGLDRKLGFNLGTDGFSVVSDASGIIASIVVQRQSLIGWHHYSIVYERGEPFVYLDGQEQDTTRSSKAIEQNRSLRVGFSPTFGRTRYRYLKDSVYGLMFYGTGFEGWLSELRLANRSMHGSEAWRQMNNSMAWDAAFSMKGCSGENHTNTDIDRFKLQQAWLVCKEPLPTCGSTTPEFQPWEQAGCLCEQADESRSCVAGFVSPDDVVFAAKPLAYWQLDQSTFDSGAKFNGSFVGSVSRDFEFRSENGSTFTSFKGSGYVSVNDLDFFLLSRSEFSIDAKIRVKDARSMMICAQHVYSALYCAFYISSGTLVLQMANGATSLQLVTPGPPIVENEWHVVRATRKNGICFLVVDGVTRAQKDCFGAVQASAPVVLIAAQNYGSGPTDYFTGDIEFVSISSGDGPLCARRSFANMISSPSLTARGCQRIVGFCTPTKPDRQCCAAAGCLECTANYHTCTRNFIYSTTTGTATTATSTTITSTTSTNTLPSSTSTSLTTPISTTATTLTTDVVTLTTSTDTMLIPSTTSNNSSSNNNNSTPTTTSPSSISVRSSDSEIPVWIYGVAGGGGGLVVLIIVIITLACVCRKRNKNGDDDETKMTTIDNNGKFLIIYSYFFAYFFCYVVAEQSKRSSEYAAFSPEMVSARADSNYGLRNMFHFLLCCL